jgi:hypothetical protein
MFMINCHLERERDKTMLSYSETLESDLEETGRITKESISLYIYIYIYICRFVTNLYNNRFSKKKLCVYIIPKNIHIADGSFNERFMCLLL